MKNINELTNEDINLLVDFIVKPGGPADEATRRAIDLFCRDGIKSLITVGVSGDTQAFFYIHQKIVDRIAVNMGGAFVPAGTEAH